MVIAHYLNPKIEETIIAALRLYGENFVSTGDTHIGQPALDYADALENDTFLLETTTEPGAGRKVSCQDCKDWEK